ncbi:sigma-70 family RNA polymerase sigma factor [Candidatus Pacearchaeota archaeon]|nr:sigma-70 family RNA polymerase sigma factor [Candidatus Pacearchaeota archaeon]
MLPQEEVVDFIRDHVAEFVAIWHPMISGIYRRHGYSSRIIELEDMQQEAVVKVLECLERYDPERTRGATNYSKLTNFLVTCVHRELISQSFRNCFSVHIPSGSMRVVGPDMQDRCRPMSKGLETIPAEDEGLDNIIEATNIIEAFDQDGILTMYYLEGLTQEEVANRIGTTTSTISRKLTSIENKIRKQMKDHND